MPSPTPRDLRRAYWRALLEGLRISWPVLGVIVGLKAALGAVVGLVEGWGIAEGIYFAFITGLTVGYGDLVPTRPLTRVLAVVIAFAGIVLAGLIAALAVRAFQVSRDSDRP